MKSSVTFKHFKALIFTHSLTHSLTYLLNKSLPVRSSIVFLTLTESSSVLGRIPSPTALIRYREASRSRFRTYFASLKTFKQINLI